MDRNAAHDRPQRAMPEAGIPFVKDKRHPQKTGGTIWAADRIFSRTTFIIRVDFFIESHPKNLHNQEVLEYISPYRSGNSQNFSMYQYFVLSMEWHHGKT
jgi:hypothetical protein